MAEGLFHLCCLWFFLGSWVLPVGNHPNADSQGVGLQAPRRSLLGPLGCLVLWSRRCLTWPTTCKSPSVPAPVWSPLTLEGVPPGNVPFSATNMRLFHGVDSALGSSYILVLQEPHTVLTAPFFLHVDSVGCSSKTLGLRFVKWRAGTHLCVPTLPGTDVKLSQELRSIALGVTINVYGSDKALCY